MSEREFLIRSTLLGLVGILLLTTGCSMFDSKDQAPPLTIDGAPVVRYSDNSQLLNPSNRNYTKMTRTRLEEESELHAQAGSMWVMEGQGAYLFAQNKTRREGDLLSVKVEGAGMKQVQTKVTVIKSLLKKLEDEELRKKESEAGPAIQKAASANKDAVAKPGQAKAGASRAPAAEPAVSERIRKDEDEAASIESVPTRIVERLPDGNYRVKGMQPFMIGNREYKAIVTGIVRPEDFNDEGISSSKLLDPQFDVVSLRRKMP